MSPVHWATPLRQQLLNSGELKAAAGEPLVDLVGPGSQSVLGGPRSLPGYSHPLGQRDVLPDGFPGQSRP